MKRKLWVTALLVLVVMVFAGYGAMAEPAKEATIGTTEYDTLVAAIAAANSGETVTILKDVTLTADLTIPANVTLVVPTGLTLTVAGGASLTVVGTVDVAGTLAAAAEGSQLVMTANGKFVFQNSAKLTDQGKVYIGEGGEFVITSGTMEIASSMGLGLKTIVKGDVVLKESITIGTNDEVRIESGSLTVATGKTLTVAGTVDVAGTLAAAEGSQFVTTGAGKFIFQKDAKLIALGDVHIGKGGEFEITSGTMEIASSTALDFKTIVKGNVVLKKDMEIVTGDEVTIESGSLTVADNVTLTVEGKLEAKAGAVGKALSGKKAKAARAASSGIIVNGTIVMGANSTIAIDENMLKTVAGGKIVVAEGTAKLTIGGTALVGDGAALTLGTNGKVTLTTDTNGKVEATIAGAVTVAKDLSVGGTSGVQDLTVAAGAKLTVAANKTLTAEPDSKVVLNGNIAAAGSDATAGKVDIKTEDVSGNGTVPATTKYLITCNPADKITVKAGLTNGYATKATSVKLEVAEAYRPWFTGWTITPAIPTVDLKGLTITFTADKVYTVTATFAAPLKVTPAVATVEVGKTVQLAAAKDGAAVAATWVSGTPTIATVDASGLVTGVADGSATITATFGGESATCVVTVGKAIAPTPGPTPGPTPSPEADPDASETVKGVWTDELALGKKGALELPKLKGAVIEWTSDNAAIAKIGKRGQSVVGVALGEATLTGVVSGAKDASLDGRALKPGDKLTVKVYVRRPGELVKKVVPSSKKVTLAPQATAKLTVSVSPASAIDDKIYWKSENPKIATVTKDGTVTAVAPGKVKLVALSTNLKKTSVMVTVTGDVTKVTLTPAKKTIAVGETLIVSAQVNPDAFDKTLTWTVGKKGRNYITLTENPDGTYTVTALKPGKAKITVKAPNGKKAVCTVTVK